MEVKFVDFGAQYLQHKDEYDEAIFRCLEKGKLVLQEDVGEFEKNLAKYLGFKYAIAVANGTDALFLVLKAKGITGQEIAVTDYTFKATHEVVSHSGNTLKRLEIGLDDRTPYSHADIPVHIEGLVAQVNEMAIMEDAAQAFGAKGVGKSGTITCSFYPAKILGCFGDGGAVCTNDEEVYRKVKLLRHHWQTDKDEEYGYNSRLDNVQAAFLNVKLKYIDEILKRREEIAMMYKELEGIVGLPYYQEGRVWQDYVITTPNPGALAGWLKDQGIQTLGCGMTPPHVAMNSEPLPNIQKLYSEMLRLPLNETLTDFQIEYVISNVKEFFNGIQTV